MAESLSAAGVDTVLLPDAAAVAVMEKVEKVVVSTSACMFLPSHVAVFISLHLLFFFVPVISTG